MKKVIIHIGVPKTATTLLQQHVFPNITDHIDYIGVIQPRTSKQDPLYSELWNLVCLDEAEYEVKLDDVKARVRQRVNSNNLPLVISEECFCLNSGETLWQNKLIRLGEVFCEYNVQILITTREPVSALFSFYVELYNSLKLEYADLIDFTDNSNLAKLYDYEYLDSVLRRAFSSADISYVPFELIKSNYFVSAVLDVLGVNQNIVLDLPNTNAKRKSATSIKTNPRSLTFYLLSVRKIRLFSKIIEIPIIKFMGKRFVKAVGDLKVPLSGTKVMRPTEKEIEKLKIKYASSLSFISTKTDVDYRH
ncbi:hypothetical protein [Thalassotalea sp. Y01]|uniref:hypothetical protein n=1 Tax=Thalassotalea sp. Y01 TaxID=2729613 RepID=UPI00145DBCDA|nr:hypothetical protein [Thalassotalea sp. Y01]NMP16500.1 hypothetical protein [Thalassotalea sp. Y01]